MPFDKQTSDDIFPWSPWVPLGSAALATLGMTVALHQRDMVGSVPLAALYGVVAVLPFLLDAVDVFVPFRTALPLWLFPIPVLVGTGLLVSTPSDVDLAPFIFVFLVAEVASRSGRLPISIGTLVAANGIMIGLDLADRFDQSFIWVIGITFGWFGGLLIQMLVRRTTALSEAQSELAAKAATDERQRIAREVHDVIAHSMSVTMLHVTAARMALERDRTADALDALKEAERQGRSSLNDIRRTVGLLGPDESAVAPPAPGASDLPKLVSDFRSAGIDVTLHMNADVGSLPEAVGLGLYRIVQESLTNAARYAPGASATVDLTIGEEIRLLITNGSTNGAPIQASSSSGLGIRGMSERAALLGGELRAGPDGAGWIVELVAPLPN